MVGQDVVGTLKPEGGQLVEHLTLEWNMAHHSVEGRETVGGDEHPLSVYSMEIANLPLATLAQAREVDFCQYVRDGPADLINRQHVSPYLTFYHRLFILPSSVPANPGQRTPLGMTSEHCDHRLRTRVGAGLLLIVLGMPGGESAGSSHG